MVKHYIAVALLVIAVTVVLSLAIGGLDNLLPPLASEQGGFVDRLLGIELQLILFVFALIMMVMLYSVVVFRRKSEFRPGLVVLCAGVPGLRGPDRT